MPTKAKMRESENMRKAQKHGKSGRRGKHKTMRKTQNNAEMGEVLRDAPKGSAMLRGCSEMVKMLRQGSTWQGNGRIVEWHEHA